MTISIRYALMFMSAIGLASVSLARREDIENSMWIETLPAGMFLVACLFAFFWAIERTFFSFRRTSWLEGAGYFLFAVWYATYFFAYAAFYHRRDLFGGHIFSEANEWTLGGVWMVTRVGCFILLPALWFVRVSGAEE